MVSQFIDILSGQEIPPVNSSQAHGSHVMMREQAGEIHAARMSIILSYGHVQHAVAHRITTQPIQIFLLDISNIAGVHNYKSWCKCCVNTLKRR